MGLGFLKRNHDIPIHTEREMDILTGGGGVGNREWMNK